MIKINLITVRIPKDHLIVQRQAMSVVGGVILSIIIVGWWASHASATKEEVQNQLEGEKAKLQRLEQVATRIEEFEKKKLRREQILDAIKKLETRKVGPRLFLDDLNMILPSDVWLSKITQRDVTISVSGYSFSNSAIADLMRAMEASPNFSDMELGQITNEVMKGEDIKNFTLNCGWEAVKKLEEKPASPKAPAEKK
ncbi:MAG: PilN domain-containing protein [Nitrospinae bacterium]|nr:PilN domain-containing protein [Nitrospinota bacterium]